MLIDVERLANVSGGQAAQLAEGVVEGAVARVLPRLLLRAVPSAAEASEAGHAKHLIGEALKREDILGWSKALKMDDRHPLSAD